MSPEPDFTDGIVVYALLLDKSAIGIYTGYAKAEEAWDMFLKEHQPAKGFTRSNRSG